MEFNKDDSVIPLVGRKPDFAKPSAFAKAMADKTSRPILRHDTTQSEAAPKRSGDRSRRAQRLAICNRDSAPDLSRAVNAASIHFFWEPSVTSDTSWAKP